MNRQLIISRLLVVATVLLLAVWAFATPARPPAPTASGCTSPPIGALAAIFDTCAECEFIGSDGASQGAWTTWHCRARPDGYYLYVT